MVLSPSFHVAIVILPVLKFNVFPRIQVVEPKAFYDEEPILNDLKACERLTGCLAMPHTDLINSIFYLEIYPRAYKSSRRM